MKNELKKEEILKMVERDFITEDDTIYNIVKKYPQLKKVLTDISSKFKRLENPLLFNSLAKITTVKKAAAIGNIYLKDMLYKLNEAIGKEEEYFNYEKSRILKIKDGYLKNIINEDEHLEEPEWLEGKTNKILDVRDFEQDPFKDIIESIKKLDENSVLKVIQNFKPIPLITYLSKEGIDYYIEEISKKEYNIYFYKNV